MKKLLLCSIYDTKAEVYTAPMQFQSAAQALRSFTDAVNNKQSDFGKHPEDYVLLEIGSWDERSGEIEPCVPTSLGVGINFVKESEV